MSDKIGDASNNGNQQFNNAANPQPKQQGVESEQVKKDHPYPEPPPPPSLGNAPKRQTHYENMSKDDKAVQLYNAANARKEPPKQLELDLDKNKNKDKDEER